VLAAGAAEVALLVAMVAVELRTAEPMVALRLLGNRMFRSSVGVLIPASIAFLGTLYAISLYYQDGRGLTALGSGLSTFPAAIGVMTGAQLASRVLYPRLGPRRHITLRLTGTAVSVGLLSPMTAHSSVWWAPAADVHHGMGHGPGLRAQPGGHIRHHLTGETTDSRNDPQT
jgi:hypothetical protein